MAKKYISTTLTGSHAWTDTTIWAGGVVPVTGDDVTLLSAPRGFLIDSGLAQSAVTLASLTICNSFGGAVGGLGNAPLAISYTAGAFGTPPADGTTGVGIQDIKIDTGTVVHATTIYGSSQQGSESPLPAICLRGVNSSNVINVLGGVVGIGVLVPGEASTIATINTRGGRTEVGSGVTYATAVNDGGSLVLNAGTSATIMNISGGIRTAGTWLATAITNSDLMQITHRAASGVSITTLTTNVGSVTDFSANPVAISATTTNLNGGQIVQFQAAQFAPGTLTLGAAMTSFTVGTP